MVKAEKLFLDLFNIENKENYSYQIKKNLKEKIWMDTFCILVGLTDKCKKDESETVDFISESGKKFELTEVDDGFRNIIYKKIYLNGKLNNLGNLLKLTKIKDEQGNMKHSPVIPTAFLDRVSKKIELYKRKKIYNYSLILYIDPAIDAHEMDIAYKKLSYESKKRGNIGYSDFWMWNSRQDMLYWMKIMSKLFISINYIEDKEIKIYIIYNYRKNMMLTRLYPSNINLKDEKANQIIEELLINIVEINDPNKHRLKKYKKITNNLVYILF